MTRSARHSWSLLSLHAAFRILAIVLLIAMAVVSILLAWNWPFTREEVTKSLEKVSATNVHIGRFEETYLPHPGYVAQDVTFRREPAGSRPLARVRRVTCRASWLALVTFTHRVSRVDLEGAEVYIPRPVPRPIRKYPQEKIATTVGELFANGTILEIAPREAGSPTIRFDFPELALTDLARNKSITFRTLLRNRNLIGDLKAVGSVGPLRFDQIGETNVAGTYQLSHTDLGTHKVIAGNLSASGKFNGTLGHAKVAGRTDIPDFEVTRSHHSVKLSANYNVLVNGTNGDTIIESTEAHFLDSTLTARGSITGTPGKTVSLDLDGRQARVQDVLHLFVKSDQPPLDGKLTLHAHVVLPPKQEPFLKKVKLEGDFTIAEAAFTKPATAEKLAELSARARGVKKAKAAGAHTPVSLELKSQIQLQDGIATLSQALFSVPGAITRGGGTYNLMNEAVHLNGELAMNSTLSKAAGGIKSVLLLPVDPFFKKDGAGAVLPVHVRGTYSHPSFKVSLR